MFLSCSPKCDLYQGYTTVNPILMKRCVIGSGPILKNKFAATVFK